MMLYVTMGVPPVMAVPEGLQMMQLRITGDIALGTASLAVGGKGATLA